MLSKRSCVAAATFMHDPPTAVIPCMLSMSEMSALCPHSPFAHSRSIHPGPARWLSLWYIPIQSSRPHLHHGSTDGAARHCFAVDGAAGPNPRLHALADRPAVVPSLHRNIYASVGPDCGSWSENRGWLGSRADGVRQCEVTFSRAGFLSIDSKQGLHIWQVDAELKTCRVMPQQGASERSRYASQQARQL